MTNGTALDGAWPGLTTAMLTVPSSAASETAAGTVNVTCVGVTESGVKVKAPNVTAAPWAKPVPVRVTLKVEFS